MSFQPLTQPVDHITLAGQRSPGVADLTDTLSDSDIQERKGYGLGGAYAVYKGLKIAYPKVTIKLVTSQHWDDWHAWRPLIARPPTGRRPRALDIWHPILEDLGITSVLVKSYTQPTQTGDGEWSVVITFVEYRRPQRALVTPDGSDTDALTPGDLEILALRNQVTNQVTRNQQTAAEIL